MLPSACLISVRKLFRFYTLISLIQIRLVSLKSITSRLSSSVRPRRTSASFFAFTPRRRFVNRGIKPLLVCPSLTLYFGTTQSIATIKASQICTAALSISLGVSSSLRQSIKRASDSFSISVSFYLYRAISALLTSLSTNRQTVSIGRQSDCQLCSPPTAQQIRSIVIEQKTRSRVEFRPPLASLLVVVSGSTACLRLYISAISCSAVPLQFSTLPSI